MKKNDYQNLMEHIRPPAGLNDRVLFAARRRAAGSRLSSRPVPRVQSSVPDGKQVTLLSAATRL